MMELLNRMQALPRPKQSAYRKISGGLKMETQSVGKGQMKGSTYLEPARELPAAAYDVVVAGGGPAGFGAALGAVRAGAKTLLIERNGFLGGTATAGLMANLNITGEHLVGAAHDLLYRLAERDEAWMGRVVTFSPEHMKQAALEMLDEAGVDLLFYTMASRPILEENRVRGLVVENKSGRQAFFSPVLVDCTGDADLAYRAGAPTVIGRESDHKMRPFSVLFRMGNIDLKKVLEYVQAHPDQFNPDPYRNVVQPDRKVLRIEGFYDIMAAARDRGELAKDIHYMRLEGIDAANGTIFVNTVRVYGLDGSDAAQLTRGEIECRRQMLQIADVIRKYVPGCERAFVIDSSVNIGVRETRRILGEYIYDEVDAWNKVKHPDTVLHLWRRAALGSEMHSPDAGEGLRDADFYERQKRLNPGEVPPPPERDFYFPYRSLIPQKLDGMLVAGRSMSVTHMGDTWTRAIMIVMACGQAAGVAGALAARNGVGVRQVDAAQIRQVLAAQGADVGEAFTK